jgi:hypothetical protein
VTTNDDITITAAVVLSHHVVIDSGAGAGNISFSSTIDGTTPDTQSLTLDGGAGGTVNVPGSIGGTVPLRTLTLVDSNGADFGTSETDTIHAETATVVQGSVPGSSVRFNGKLLTNSLTAAAGPYQLLLHGHESVIGTSSLLNTGSITFGDSDADLLTFRGPLTAVTQSSVELFARIHTHGSAVTLGSSTAAINLHTETAVIDTTNGEDPLFVNGAQLRSQAPWRAPAPQVARALT